jgi:hypothetical protein
VLRHGHSFAPSGTSAATAFVRLPRRVRAGGF